MTVRTFLAAALLAPSLALAAPQSKSTSAQPTTTQAPASGIEVGGFIGYEAADFTGLALRADVAMPFRDLGPQVKLSFVGSLGYSYLTWGGPFGTTVKSNLFKIVPAARFTFPVAPQFDLFGDVGLGIAHASVTADLPFGYGSYSDSSTNLMMRFGVGGWYKVAPKVKLGAMFDLDPIFGDYGVSNTYAANSQTFWSMLFGAMFTL
jgi:hypothetical protein